MKMSGHDSSLASFFNYLQFFFSPEVTLTTNILGHTSQRHSHLLDISVKQRLVTFSDSCVTPFPSKESHP